MREFDCIKYNDIFKLKFDYFRDELNKIKNGSTVKIIIKSIPEHREESNEQLNLYWACCQEFSENSSNINWNTKEKVDEQIKIALKFYDFLMVVDNVVHIKTKSISYDNLKDIDRNNYFSQAFKEISGRLGLSEEEFISNVKAKMRGNNGRLD